jgi:hypothetical protein
MNGKTASLASWAPLLGTLLAWIWAFLAGGGGLWLLLTKGPWPLTNGWFVLFSGLAACPLTAWAVKRIASIDFTGRARFVSALLFFVAGHIALLLEGQRSGLL